ncbi:MAG: hypothetical protein U1E76_24110 [Planctomycetota bacterium]
MLAAAAAPRRIDFTLHRHPRMAVFVTTEAGTPVNEPQGKQELAGVDAGALVVVATCVPPRGALLAPGSPVCLSSWQHAGDAVPPPRPLGYLELLAPAPLYASLVYRSAVIATEPISPGQDLISFTVARARLLAMHASLAIAITSEPAAGPIVLPRIGLDMHVAATEWVTQALAHDAQGALIVPSVPLGPQMLRLHGSSHAWMDRYIDIAPGENHIAVTLEPAAAIAGMVVDARGRPAEAALTVIPLDSPERRIAPIHLGYGIAWQTRGDGSFQIDGCGAGRYLLRAHTPSTSAIAAVSEPLVVDTRSPPGSIVLELRPATQVALDYLGRTHAFVYAEIQDANDLPLWHDRIHDGITTVLLLPGAYRLRLAAEIAAPRSVYPLQIGATAAQLQLPPIEGAGCETERDTTTAPPSDADAPAGRAAVDGVGAILRGEIHGAWDDAAPPTFEIRLVGAGRTIQSQITPPCYAIAGLSAGSYRIEVKGSAATLETALEVGVEARFPRLDLELAGARSR